LTSQADSLNHYFTFVFDFANMIGKNTIKRIQSLQQKKFRRELGLFVAEGERLVNDILLSDLRVETLYHTLEWRPVKGKSSPEQIEISELEMKKISGLSTQSTVLALIRIPDREIIIEDIIDSLTIVLDDIQDPGNLGTIIRLADWFGIEHVVCSIGTVDAYSPKVIQATMGAISRVKITYVDIIEFIGNASKMGIAAYGTFMEGKNIYQTDLAQQAIVIMGNEGNGISQDVEKLITQRLTIPSFSGKKSTSESLNVAMATAIVCSEFRRRLIGY
jgi:TrmH family RNA methyltransferase